jgi:hypothetical protein
MAITSVKKHYVKVIALGGVYSELSYACNRKQNPPVQIQELIYQELTQYNDSSSANSQHEAELFLL